MFFLKSIKIKNQYYATWVLIFFLAAFFAAIDSCFVLFNPTKTAFLGLGMSEFWAKLATGVLVAVYVLVIDYALSIFYPNTINEIISAAKEKSRDAARWSIAILTAIFCIVQIFITIQVSIHLRHTSASLAIEKPNLVRVDSIVGIQAASQNNTASTLSNTIEKVESSKKQAVAKSQSNKELQRLSENGNGWAKQKLSALANSTGSKFDKSISSLTNQYTTLLNQNALTLQTIAQATAKQNEFQATIYTQKVGSLSQFLLFFVIGATFIQCFAGLLIGIYRAQYNYGNYQPMTPQNGNYQQQASGANGSNYGNYQLNTDKLAYQGSYYEPSAIKRWAQNCDKRAEKTANPERKDKFTQKAAELWAIWNAYEASKQAATV